MHFITQLASFLSRTPRPSEQGDTDRNDTDEVRQRGCSRHTQSTGKIARFTLPYSILQYHTVQTQKDCPKATNRRSEHHLRHGCGAAAPSLCDTPHCGCRAPPPPCSTLTSTVTTRKRRPNQQPPATTTALRCDRCGARPHLHYTRARQRHHQNRQQQS